MRPEGGAPPRLRRIGCSWRVTVAAVCWACAGPARAAQIEPASDAAHQPATPDQSALSTPSAEPHATAPEPAAQSKAWEDAIRFQLNGTRWTFLLTPIGVDDEANVQEDTLTFAEHQVSSEQLSKAGYAAADYSLAIADDGVVEWEAIQMKPEEGVAFWHGRLQGSSMTGAFAKHPMKGSTQDYSMRGQQVTGASLAPALSLEESSPHQSHTLPEAITAAPALPAGSSIAPSAKTSKKKSKKKGASDD